MKRAFALNDEKLFSRQDLLRFGRYVDDGRDRNVEQIFWHWFNGPTPGQDRPVTEFYDRKKARS